MGKLIKGINDLATVNPKLASEWHPTKNYPLTTEDITAHSGKKVWWIDKFGHEWKTEPSIRSAGRGCPYCSGNRVLVGFNDLATIDPELASEWHPTLNGTLTPQMVTACSHKKVWWQCKKHPEHVWQSVVKARHLQKRGCLYCVNQKVMAGYNDLGTIHPDIAAEWNYEKNEGLTPQMVTPSSRKRVWWRCSKCGYEWTSTVHHRSTSGSGCLYCAHMAVVPGKNDFATMFPHLAKEWNYERNGDLRPDMFLPRSTKCVWWIGECGHEWQAKIYARSNGNNCPICKRELHTSFPEQALFFYTKKIYPDAINGDRSTGKEADIIIPSQKIVIEVNGYHWHKNSREKDMIKMLHFVKLGYRFYVMHEAKEEWESPCERFIKCDFSKYGSLEYGIEKILRWIAQDNDIDVDLARDTIKIHEQYISRVKTNSVASTPELLAKWHPTKNGKLNPEFISRGSRKLFWWKNDRGYEWMACPDNVNRKKKKKITNKAEAI